MNPSESVAMTAADNKTRKGGKADMAEETNKTAGTEQTPATPKVKLEQRKTKTLEFRLAESQLMPSSKKDNVHSVHQGEVGDFIFKIPAKLEDGKVTISWPWKEAKPVVKYRANQRKTEQRLEPLQDAIERELGADIKKKVLELNDLLEA